MIKQYVKGWLRDLRLQILNPHNIKPGDILVCEEWGAEWTKVKVIAVSKTEYMYEFLICKGSKATSGDAYTASLKYSKYIPEEARNV